MSLMRVDHAVIGAGAAVSRNALRNRDTSSASFPTTGIVVEPTSVMGVTVPRWVGGADDIAMARTMRSIPASQVDCLMRPSPASSRAAGSIPHRMSAWLTSRSMVSWSSSENPKRALTAGIAHRLRRSCPVAREDARPRTVVTASVTGLTRSWGGGVVNRIWLAG